MTDRVSGPMKFRLVMQPLMAIIIAIRGGLLDARSGRPPYLLTLATDSAQRIELLRDGWKNVGRVALLAIALDTVYQLIVLHRVYPGEAVIVSFLLAVMPYVMVRGITNRIAREH